MATLSVVIVAKNEERIIGRTLDAVRSIADEILVVDSGSEDKTLEIATSKGARVVHQDWLGYAGQKNFALSLAKSDWLLSLDADEVLTPESVAEIKAIVSGELLASAMDTRFHAFSILGNIRYVMVVFTLMLNCV